MLVFEVVGFVFMVLLISFPFSFSFPFLVKLMLCVRFTGRVLLRSFLADIVGSHGDFSFLCFSSMYTTKQVYQMSANRIPLVSNQLRVYKCLLFFNLYFTFDTKYLPILSFSKQRITPTTAPC